MKPLESRRGQARVAAMRFLYEREYQRELDLAEALRRHFEFMQVKDGVAGYARMLIEGVAAKEAEIDPLIESHLDNWKLSRLTRVDRIVLRLGVYEMLYGDGVPPKVIINEMVELAKLYSTADSSSFTNGILDAAYHALQREGKLG